MRWERVRLEVAGEWSGAAAVNGGGSVAAGPFELALHDQPPGEWPTTTWAIANRSDEPVAVERVALVHRLHPSGSPRLFANGYQSWSSSQLARPGIDRDPSAAPGSISLVRALHHADDRIVADGALRSEMVTVLADDGPARLLVGFDAGYEHDGTVWLRERDDGYELTVEAHLGGAVLEPGEQRPLHAVLVAEGTDHADLLDAWATYAGAVQGARTAAAYQVGWCSWYHYFHEIDEPALRANLARAGDWPFDVFQLDDGFQPTIGDWTATNEGFPSDLDRLAADIRAAGCRPGLWLAPFLVAPDSEVVRAHPDWVARHASGRPLIGSVNPPWGGAVWTLDTSNPEVLAHLQQVAADVVDAGFDYLKLDFTYAPAIPGGYADRSRTPAQRVRAGYDAIRRGAGDDAFLLGCGAPLGCTVGVVDGMRIGADVAPAWEVEAGFPGYEATAPSTANAMRNTVSRSFMHRRLWLNDPDCLMLRTAQTRLSAEAATTWARAVGVSGGMALVSDDLALLGDDARRLLDEALVLGREADGLAASGGIVRCLDLLDEREPGRLRAGPVTLVADPATGASRLRRGLEVSGA
jgi:alpha-galactosidase